MQKVDTAAIDTVNETLEAAVRRYDDTGLRTKYSSSINASKDILEVAYAVQSFLLEFNAVKRQLDDAHRSNNAEQFSAHLVELNTLLYRVGFTNLLTKFNRRKRWLKVVSELRQHVLNQLNFIRQARDNGAKHLKHMRMSPKQREAAKRASIRQQLAWGV